jgi:hypothetical protein
MYDSLKKLYLFVQTVPDRLYPFAADVEGRFVRGRESYKRALEASFSKYGPNHFGFKLTFYRGTFHLVGSIVWIMLAAYISQRWFGSEIALYSMMAFMIIGIFIQEFYWQPRKMGQLRYKGVVDWLTWVTPVFIYFFFI